MSANARTGAKEPTNERMRSPSNATSEAIRDAGYPTLIADESTLQCSRSTETCTARAIIPCSLLKRALSRWMLLGGHIHLVVRALSRWMLLGGSDTHSLGSPYHTLGWEESALHCHCTIRWYIHTSTAYKSISWMATESVVGPTATQRLLSLHPVRQSANGPAIKCDAKEQPSVMPRSLYYIRCW